MTHVSKNPLDPTTFTKIRKNLKGAVSAQHEHGPEILEALLTAAERTMLAKRLAIILMLERKASYYQICHRLKVSIATVIRVNRCRVLGHFAPIQKALMRKKNPLTFSEEIELLLAIGMPSIAGPRHTAYLNKLRRKKKGLL